MESFGSVASGSGDQYDVFGLAVFLGFIALRGLVTALWCTLALLEVCGICDGIDPIRTDLLSDIVIVTNWTLFRVVQ